MGVKSCIIMVDDGREFKFGFGFLFKVLEVTQIVTVILIGGFEFGLAACSLEMKFRQGFISAQTFVGPDGMIFERGVGSHKLERQKFLTI